MLDDLFMTILDMSKVASVAILVVLAVRLLLKGAPKVFSYALWAVVLFRLLCPFSIGQTTLSLVPEITPTAETYELNDEPISMADAGSAVYKAIGDALNGGLGVQRIHTTDVEADGSFRVVTADWYDVWILAGQYVWLAVLLVLLLRSGISYRKLKRSIGVSIPLRDNIFLADDLGSPFVVGLLRPKIYLPSNLSEEEQSYIILHEQHHIRRGDHIFKALAFIALCLHWFNPLVWVAFILAGKDMEMSCDEAVIRKVGSHVRADYSASLLTLATGRRIIAGTPLAFGEGDTKGRIHNLARWKKPARWIVILSVVLCLILAVCLLTNPAKGMPLRKIEGRSNFKITNDETVIMNSFGLETEVTELEEFQKALSEIKVIRNPIDQSRSEDRDSSHQIILGDRFFLNFSWDYRTVWIDDLVKPSYTYTVSNPMEVAKIFRDYSDVGFNWGITLKAENVSPDGAKITMTQTGGYIQFRLMYGDDYHIEKNENGQWVNVEPIGSFISDLIATTVPLNDSVSWNINWSSVYGSLEPGMYRFCKTITDSHAPGNSDDVTFYAEFEISVNSVG